ncbi:MAG: hypothetical protein AAGH79_09295 [Bacteroidota bacterium]
MYDWHINLVQIRSRNWFLFTHSISLFTFFIAAGRIRKSSQLVAEFEQELSLFIIRNISVKDGYIEKLIPRNSTYTFAKGTNRSVLGSMNDFKYQIEYFIIHRGISSYESKDKIILSINTSPMSGIGYQSPLPFLLERINRS